MQSYSRKEVAKILKITDRTVWFYTEQGCVKPEIDNPKGKGTTRLYSAKNIMEIAVARKLAEHGLKLEVIRQIMNMPRILAARDNFDPWNPTAQKAEAEGRRYFLDIFDPTTDKGRLFVYGSNPDEPTDQVSETRAGRKEIPFEVRIVIDLTRIREKIRTLLN